MTDPKAVILDFLSKLPITIRENVLSLCLMASNAFPYDNHGQDLLPLVADLLNADPRVFEGYRVGMLAAIVQIALADDGVDHEEMYKELTEKLGPELFASMAAQVPLKKRHTEVSLREFEALRAGVLSPEALRKWGNYQMAQFA